MAGCTSEIVCSIKTIILLWFSLGKARKMGLMRLGKIDLCFEPKRTNMHCCWTSRMVSNVVLTMKYLNGKFCSSCVLTVTLKNVSYGQNISSCGDSFCWRHFCDCLLTFRVKTLF